MADYVSNITSANGQVLKIKDAEAREGIEQLSASIDKKVSTLNNRKFVFIGDSYAHPSEFTTKSWYNYVCDFLNLTNGLNAFRNSWGGTGFVASNDLGYNFITLVQGADTGDVPTTEITDVVVVGGYNDANASKSQLEIGVNNFISACNTRFPNAKIWVGICGWTLDTVNMPPLRLLHTNMSTICCERGISYLTDVYPSLHLYLEDNPLFAVNVEVGGRFHPNEEGSLYIGRNVACGLLGTRCEQFIGNYQAKVDGGNFTISGLYTNYVNHTKKLLTYAFSATINNGTVPLNSWFTIGNMHDCTIMPQDTIWINTYASLVVLNVEAIICPCNIQITADGEVSLQLVVADRTSVSGNIIVSTPNLNVYLPEDLT